MTTTRQRWVTVALLVAVLVGQTATVAASATAVGVTEPSATTPSPGDLSPSLATGALTQTSNNTTTGASDNQTVTENETGPPPGMAESVRITPIRYDEEHLGVTVAESDAVFNTTGPHVLFSLSEPIETARITQAPAEATVLAGGQQVLVEYKDDAAPTGEQSLYALELYFTDGSKKTIDLYARKTGVSVAASDLEEYAPVIEELKEFAEEHGYETTPEGLLDYMEYSAERADLLDNFLSKKVAEFLMTLLMLATNWVSWLVFLGMVALLAQYIRSKYSDFWDTLENSTNRAKLKREQLQQQYEELKQSADEESLEEVDGIGMNAAYWRAAFNARSPKQLADLAESGEARMTEDGLETVHNGVEDLDTETIGTTQCWLEPVLRDGYFRSPREALIGLKNACKYMDTKWNMGHVYHDAFVELESLIDDLDESTQRPGVASGGGD